ncbi:hypothetical protein ES705_49783 [subsurface metagenome]
MRLCFSSLPLSRRLRLDFLDKIYRKLPLVLDYDFFCPRQLASGLDLGDLARDLPKLVSSFRLPDLGALSVGDLLKVFVWITTIYGELAWVAEACNEEKKMVPSTLNLLISISGRYHDAPNIIAPNPPWRNRDRRDHQRSSRKATMDLLLRCPACVPAHRRRSKVFSYVYRATVCARGMHSGTDNTCFRSLQEQHSA